MTTTTTPSTHPLTLIRQASHFGHAEVVRLLLRHGANVDLPNHKGEFFLAKQRTHRCLVLIMYINLHLSHDKARRR